MDEEDFSCRVCCVLECAGREAQDYYSDGACGSSESGRVLGAALREETVLELHDVFGSYERAGEALSRGTRVRCEIDGGLWEDLASRRVCVGSVVQGLTRVMEGDARLGVLAVDAYLGMLLSTGCPLYSLFSQLTFHALVRCIRNACKPNLRSAQDGSEERASTQRRRKGQPRRKGTIAAAKLKEASEDANFTGNDSFQCDEMGTDNGVREANTGACLQDVLHVLVNLQSTLRILHLKDHQETLKSLLELLVELPHLISEIQDEDGNRDEAGLRGQRARRAAGKSSTTPVSALQLSFSMMNALLEPCHGEPGNTAVILLKLLTPSILLTRAGGSAYQKGQIRAQCLQFVTKDVVGLRQLALQTVVTALPRYLAFKAPDRSEARALAVEAVISVVKVLHPKEQRNYGSFAVKLSRGKPRHRLFAVDLAVALLEELPNPLGLDREADDEDSLDGSGIPVCCFDRSQDDANAEEDIGGGMDKMQAETQDPMSVEIDIGENSRGSTEWAQENATPEVEKESNPSRDSVANQWWGVACLEALLHRCSDKVPAIRARAIANLAHAVDLLSKHIRNRAVLQELLGFGDMTSLPKEHGIHTHRACPLNAWQTPGHEGISLGGQTPSPEPSMLGPGPSPHTPGIGHGDLGSLLRRRCLDEKVAVRKATLALMTKSASLLGKPPDESLLQAMGWACADSMVSIRKSALTALSEVLRKFPADSKVVSEWLTSVLPLIMDNESSLQQECETFFEELALDRIALVATLRLPDCGSKFSHVHTLEECINAESVQQELEKLLPPGILLLLKGMADGGTIASCVKRLCINLGKKKRLRASVVLALQNLITISKTLWPLSHGSTSSWTAPPGAWLLLMEVSAFIPKAVGWEFLRSHWQLMEHRERDSTRKGYMPAELQQPDNNKEEHAQSAAWAADRVHILQTISNVAVELPSEAAVDLAEELLERLEAFDMHPTEVGAHVKALTTLCKRKAASHEEGDELVRVWIEELLEKAGLILQDYVSLCKNGERYEDACQLHTPWSSTRQKGSATKGRFKGKSFISSSKASCSPTHVMTTIFTVGALVLVCPAARMGNLVTLLQTLVTSKDKKSKALRQDEIHLFHEQVASGVYAQAWIALGKICLANHDLAKCCIPLFVQELERTKSAAVRNNIMVAMTDFCIRYTALVDGYIHKLTKSLRDPCELVRRQTFVLLARLLQRDYVKWRGMLFHRFLLALVDDSVKICHMANFLFGTILKTKAPLLAYNSFVEAIFVLNDCHANVGHSELLQASETEREVFCLRGSGDAVAEKRMHIYTSLLKQMAPEHLLATSAKLCAEILASAADGLLDLNHQAVQCVLEDALKILASKEMRIGGNRGLTATDTLDTGEECGATAFAAVKGRVVTQLAKRNLVQNAIPIFIELKRLLESKHSPLTGTLMECLRVMLKEYKNEIEEILVADKQLQKEIMYDMQKHEANKARAKVVAAGSVAGASDSCLRPGNGPHENQAELNAASRPLTEFPVSQLLEKSPVSQKGKSIPSGDNIKQGTIKSQGECLTGKLVRAPSKTLIGFSNKKTSVSSAGKDSAGTSRVKWLDQTPGFQYERTQCMRSSLGHEDMRKLNINGDDLTCTVSMSKTSGEMENRSFLSPLNRTVPQKQSIVSAVGDAVAAVTVAAVLREVATGSSTPLQSMSMPRLHSSVPVTVNIANLKSEDRNSGLAGLSELETKISLESVRRRQSFSSVD